MNVGMIRKPFSRIVYRVTLKYVLGIKVQSEPIFGKYDFAKFLENFAKFLEFTKISFLNLSNRMEQLLQLGM